MAVNPKAVAGRARKQEAADRKAAEKQAAAEAEEAAKWQQGAKGKSSADERAEKAAEKAKKKAELARLTEEDDAKTPGKKSGPSKSKGAKPSAGPNDLDDIDAQIASFSATNLDDALEAMSLVSEKSDKASRGAAAGAIEKHPERRFKVRGNAPDSTLTSRRRSRRLRSATCPSSRSRYVRFAATSFTNPPQRPGLRLQQDQDLLFKRFQKSPENPFNQVRRDAVPQCRTDRPDPRVVQRHTAGEARSAQGQARGFREASGRLGARFLHRYKLRHAIICTWATPVHGMWPP